jgi:hypothetical protein
LFGPIQPLGDRWTGTAHQKEMEAGVRARRVVDERTEMLGVGRVAHVPGFFSELAARAVERRFARIDRTGRELEHRLADAVLVLAHEYGALVRCDGHDDAEPTRLADVVVLDAAAVGQLDRIAPQAKVRRVDDDVRSTDAPGAGPLAHARPFDGRREGSWPRPAKKGPKETRGSTTIEALRIGTHYQTTYGTLWKDGTYFPRGTRVIVAGLHLEQGFCVRFPAEVDGDPLETWEDWSESDFLAQDGSVSGAAEPSATVLAEAREVLDDAEDGTHLHLHETD